MGSHDEQRPETLVGDVYVARLLVDYDNALAAGDTPESISLSGEIAIEDLDHVDRIESVLRRLQVVRDNSDPAERPEPAESSSREPLSDEPPIAQVDLPDSGSRTRTLGRFEIVRELGSGGAGVVCLARDTVLERLVALKIPRPEVLLVRDLRNRFVREAQAAARLRHPNLVSVHEAGQAGAICYISSDYCDGPSLSNWIKQQPGPVSPVVAAKIVEPLAEAIDYVHSEGVLHRDLKPGNVLLEPQPQCIDESDPPAEDALPFTVKITDFGLAKIANSEASDTRTGGILGTLSYMPPEQADPKRGRQDHRADIYGLGAILYELLTGMPPFRGQTDGETLKRLLEDEPIAPRALGLTVPRDLEAICLKCLEKNPAARYATAADLAVDLRRFLAGRPTQARPLSPAHRLLRWARRRPAAAGLLGVSLAAVVAIATTTAFYVRRLERAQHDAEANALQADENAEVANTHVYASRMRLSYEALDQGDAAQAARLLEPYDEGGPLAHWRGFEWYHLKRRLHSERLRLTGHRGDVYKVVFSPDDSLLVSGGEDGTIRFWNAGTGALLDVVHGHGSCVNDLSFTPDGHTLATASCDHTVRLWDVPTRQLITTLDERTQEVHSLSFSPSGEWLVTGAHDNCAHLWNVSTHEIVCSLQQIGTVNSTVWIDENTLFVAAGGTIIKWGVPENTTQKVRCDAGSLALPADLKDLIAAGPQTTVSSVPEFSTRRINLFGHTGRIECLDTTRWGDKVATGSSDGTARIWQWQTGECLQTLTGHGDRVQSVAFSHDGKQLASGSFDGNVHLWDMRFETLPRTTIGRTATDGMGRLLCALSRDGRRLAVANVASQLEIYDLTTGAIVAQRSLDAPPQALGFRDDATTILMYCPARRQVEEWDWQADRLVPHCRVPVDKTVQATFSDRGEQLVLQTQKRELVVFDCLTEEVWFRKDFRKHEHADPVPRFAPDGRGAAINLGQVAAGWEALYLDFATKQALTRVSLRPVLGTSNDARIEVVKDQVLTRVSYLLIEPALGTDLFGFHRPSPINALTFAPDERTLATGESGGKVCLWNMATGLLLAPLEITRGTVEALRFTPDGRTLVAIVHAEGDATVPANATGASNAVCQVFVWSAVEGP